MEALQTVFNTIKQVIEMIKEFLEYLFPKKEEEAETTAPAAGE